MKIFRDVLAFVVFLSFVFLFMGCQSAGGTRESQASHVVTVDEKIESVHSFATLLEKAIGDLRSSHDYDNFILFVHGRGKHPEKAFKKSLLSDLESNYSSKVIMYHWPSWEGPLAFPEGNARASARDFAIVLKELGEYQRKNSQLLEDIKFTLLAHSMGSIILEEFALNSENNSFDKVFDTIVVSSSASAGKDHSNWIGRIDFADNIYVTVNRDDPMLGKAGVKKRARRLGKGLSNREGVKFELAKNAKYIDVSESSLGHRYYLHRDLKDRPVVKSFFNRVLNGFPATLDKDHGVKEIRRERVYVLKRYQ